MTNQAVVKEALYRDWALHNKKVQQYCKDNGLNIKLLGKMKVDYLPNRIVFLKPSDIKPVGTLDNDIETQPKAVLGVVISVEDNIINVLDCESTEYTSIIKQ